MHSSARHRCRLHPRGAAHSDTVRQAAHRAARSRQLGVGPLFRILDDRIETPGKGLIIFQGMQDHTAGVHQVAWRAFASRGSRKRRRSRIARLALLRPTIRVEGSRDLGQLEPPAQVGRHRRVLARREARRRIVVEANWRHNPWFTDVLEAERQ